MTDDNVLRRMPASVRGGNGITVSYAGGSFLVSADLTTLSVTPAGQTAPVPLADTLAYLITSNPGTSNVTTINDGFYDVPGSGGTISANDGYF